MTEKQRLRLGPLQIPLLLIGVIWTVFLVDLILPISLFATFGLQPRSPSGAIGILTMPLVHGNVTHILSNTLPLFVLTTLLTVRGRGWGTIAAITVLGGILLWIFGRGGAVHGGASGLIYGLALYHILRGIVERRVVPILVSIGIAVIYGGVLLGGLVPTQAEVSWDGHLLGAVGGGVVAVEGRKKREEKR